MLVVLAVSHKDIGQARDLLDWIYELDPSMPQHKFLLMTGALVPTHDVTDLFNRASKCFGSGKLLRQQTDSGKGWPYEPNQMFKLVAQWVSKTQSGPFFWLEPDCIPTRSGWLTALESEYKAKRVPFMGTIYPHPIKHLNGCMVYPQNVGQKNPAMLMATNKSWDIMAPGLTIQHGFNTPLIQRQLADPKTNTAMTFPDQQSLGVIRPQAVLFHGCRDLSLVQRLREAGPVRVGVNSKLDNDDTLDKMILNQTAPTVKRRFHGVTLWACCWSGDKINQDRTIRVLNFCRRWFDFDEVVLFSHLPLPSNMNWCRYIQTPHLDIAGWNIFHNRIVPLAIRTKFAMSVHEDGFPIMPGLWRNEFLEYDYIGAPWSDGVVGNGGFCIESSKFMAAKMNLPPYPSQAKIASDYYTCRVHRKEMEAQGIKFAPVDVAVEFSTETTGHEWPSFGYHGRNLQPHKYQTGWQLIQKLENPIPVPVPVPNENRSSSFLSNLIPALGK